MSEGVGIVIAAVIAGWVAFFSLIITKEQSVSDSRQKWIDALRKDIAIIVGCVTNIHGESIVGNEQELWDRVKSEFTRFKRVIARIRLRLNPHERRKNEADATKAVLHTLKQLETVFGSQKPQFMELNPLVEKLVINSQVILKANWNRVRAGETTYRITKWLTLTFTVLAAVYWALRKFGVIPF